MTQPVPHVVESPSCWNALSSGSNPRLKPSGALFPGFARIPLNFSAGVRSLMMARPMDPMEAARQRTLILRCQLGSRPAMEELYLRYNRPLGYYLRRLLDCDDSEDVEQEVWLAVIRRIGRLRTPEAFVVWLYRIARSKAINRLADRRALRSLGEQDLEIPADEPEPEFTPDDASRVHGVMARLGTAHREVLVMWFMEDLSYEQIAEVIGCKIGTVRSRLHHAKLALRDHLDKEKIS
jgi:RNA polymerase sigma factor (sigma-70 family)